MRAPRLGRADRAVGGDELTESLLAERDELDAAGRL
jgi:hypothetical protein